MFKSKIEVREFAVKQAVVILGTGTSQKDVVNKAKEIEAYIIGKAELPEISNEEEMIAGITGRIAGLFQGISGCHCGYGVTASENNPSPEEKSPKKK